MLMKLYYKKYLNFLSWMGEEELFKTIAFGSSDHFYLLFKSYGHNYLRFCIKKHWMTSYHLLYLLLIFSLVLFTKLSSSCKPILYAFSQYYVVSISSCYLTFYKTLILITYIVFNVVDIPWLIHYPVCEYFPILQMILYWSYACGFVQF